MQGYPKTRAAGAQWRICLHVARRDVVQYDNVAGNFLIAERRFAGDGRFDQPHAGPDVLDQGREVRYDRAIAVIPDVDLGRSSATCCMARSLLLTALLKPPVLLVR